MSTDFAVKWSWLTPAEQAELKQSPDGQISEALANRLTQIGLAIGMRKLTSPHGVVSWFAPQELTRFAADRR